MAAEFHWCRITRCGLLRFEGDDAQSFLQGQLTNNVTVLDASLSQYTGYCTPKGRLLAVMLLWLHDHSYFMMVPAELCESLRKRLSMYILRSKVKAADVTSEHALFGLTGACAQSFLATLMETVPHALHAVAHGNGASILHLPVNRFLLVVPASQAAAIEAALSKDAPPQSEHFWAALDIEAGIPTVAAATQEQFIPQAINFDLINAVSFNKGCYPGQEIVARTHFLGKLKQRMVRAHLHTAEMPAPGDKLYSQAFGDQASGMIVNSQCTAPNEHAVLAVVQTSDIATTSVHWKSPAGPVLEMASLPYVIK